ncbi:MAG TPA: DUF4365 domain-containing protein [Candidatus Dormibacteraeota bacterium]|nr:DUF4365 domain-containing protein [Candidatus Dormibacteraeota bacterium]
MALTLLNANQRKEQFSRAYLHTVAAVAGLQIEVSQVDTASIDATIRCDGPTDPVRLDVQLKCTARDVPLPDPLPYRLPGKNYDDLRRRASSPIILVVLVVPHNDNCWLEHQVDAWVGRHACFWLSLKGYPPLPEGQTEKTVYLPARQRLTPDELRRLMAIVAEREEL